MTVLELNKGQFAVITKLKSSDLKLKLIEMGFYKGNIVEFLFKAPFGDPIALSVNGYVISLRKEEAELVEVELLIKKC